MGSSESIGLFMDFNIYKSFETTDDNIVAPVLQVRYLMVTFNFSATHWMG